MVAPLLPRNIYEQQSHNRRLTILIMIGFTLFVALLGLGFDYFYLGSIGEEFFLPIGTAAALAVGGGASLWSLQSGAKAVLASTGARPADPANPSHRQLINVVEEMTIASGLPRPGIFVVPDPDPNAFATGRNPETSSIAVTQGLLDTLNREELQGVVAHEMSHIRNYDIRLMTVIAALMGAVLLLSDFARRGMRFGGGGRKRSSKGGGGGAAGPIMLILLILWLIGIILAPIIARMMAMSVSRKREYLADASAAELTRNPLGLASALKKIESASAPTASIKQGSAHLCIADPLGRKVNEKEGFLADMMGTHPPIEKRILALRAMAYQYSNS